MPMNPIILPNNCDRTAAKSLHPEVCDALGPSPVTIVASDVERMGFAMVQLLVSAARSEGGIALTDPSEPVREALRIAGFTSLLDDALANG